MTLRVDPADLTAAAVRLRHEALGLDGSVTRLRRAGAVEAPELGEAVAGGVEQALSAATRVVGVVAHDIAAIAEALTQLAASYPALDEGAVRPQRRP